MSKLFIDLYYFVKSSFLKIETVNDDVSYIHVIPIGTNRNWKCTLRRETKVMKKLQIIFLSNAKFFAIILFRSKALLIMHRAGQRCSELLALIGSPQLSFSKVFQAEQTSWPNWQTLWACTEADAY